MFCCYTHQWASDEKQCPACVTTTTSTSINVRTETDAGNFVKVPPFFGGKNLNETTETIANLHDIYGEHLEVNDEESCRKFAIIIREITEHE